MSDHDDSSDVERLNHPTDSMLAAYLDGALTGEEHAEVEGHLAECAECRAALADTVSVLDAPAADDRARPPRELAARRRRRVPWWIGVAALAASVVGVAVLRRPSGPADIEAPTRDRRVGAPDDRIPQLPAISPANNASEPTTRPTFVWASDSVNRYRFTLLTADGAPLWTRDLSDTTLTIPADVQLQRGRSYFWRVDAMSAGIVASTPARSFTVAP